MERMSYEYITKKKIKIYLLSYLHIFSFAILFLLFFIFINENHERKQNTEKKMQIFVLNIAFSSFNTIELLPVCLWIDVVKVHFMFSMTNQNVFSNRKTHTESSCGWILVFGIVVDGHVKCFFFSSKVNIYDFIPWKMYFFFHLVRIYVLNAHVWAFKVPVCLLFIKPVL